MTRFLEFQAHLGLRVDVSGFEIRVSALKPRVQSSGSRSSWTLNPEPYLYITEKTYLFRGSFIMVSIYIAP